MGLSRIVVQDGASPTEMSVGDFLALPLDRRVRLVLEQQLQFLDELGRPIPVADGVKLLRAAR